MNDDYISRAEVVTQLCNIMCAVDPQDCQFKIPHDGAEHCTVVGAILDIPSADVRSVVLCKDCQYWNPKKKYCEGIGDWWCGNVSEWSENGFCYRGERIEEDIPIEYFESGGK